MQPVPVGTMGAHHPPGNNGGFTIAPLTGLSWSLSWTPLLPASVAALCYRNVLSCNQRPSQRGIVNVK